jgi:hypothetical protein
MAEASEHESIPERESLARNENVIDRERNAQQQTKAEVPRLLPALQYRLQQKEALMKLQTDSGVWLPEAREAKMRDFIIRAAPSLACASGMARVRSVNSPSARCTSADGTSPGILFISSSIVSVGP